MTYTYYCIVCGNKKISWYIGKFCSHKCRGEYISKMDNPHKELIKKDFLESHSYVKTAKKFSVTKQRVHQIVADYHATGEKLRRRFHIKLKNNCEVCGKKAVHLHHSDFNNKNNDVKNLKSLCKKCHYNAHKAHRREIFPSCTNCGRNFDREIKSYQLKKRLCDTCENILEGTASGRNLFYREKCVDCGKKLYKGKRSNGRCPNCLFRYKNSLQKDYFREYYKRKRYASIDKS